MSWPAALVQVSWNASYIILYNILGRLQEGSITAMAALTNSLRIEAIIYLPVFALNMAASVLTGQNLGAGSPERAEKIGWKISFAGVVFVSAMALPIFIWAGAISSPVAKDPQVLAETVRYLRIMMLSEPFLALSMILGGCLQGAGDTKGAMLVIVSALWIIRLPLAYLLACCCRLRRLWRMDSHGHLNVLSGHRHDCQVQNRTMEVHKALGLKLY